MEHGLFLAAAALAATVAVAACKSNDGGGDTTAAAAPAAAGDVVRYPTGEVADTGTFTVRTTVRAHKAADINSAGVEILQPGSTVSRLARYGAFSLVQWGTMNGMKQAWVETSQMLRPIYYDAGVGMTIGQAGFGNQGQPPTGAVPTAPATTVAPPPATTAPPATTTRPMTTTVPPAKKTTPATVKTAAPPVKVK